MMNLQNCSDCKQPTLPECRSQQTSAWRPRKAYLCPRPARSTRCRITEAWRTCGTWMTATLCAGTGRHKPDYRIPQTSQLRQCPGRADSARRSSKRSFHDSLIGLGSGRLKNTLLSKGCLATSDKNRRPVSHAGLPQVALPLGRMRGRCRDAGRLHDQRAKKRWVVGSVGISLGR